MQDQWAAPNDCLQRSACSRLMTMQCFSFIFYFGDINIWILQQPPVTNKAKKMRIESLYYFCSIMIHKHGMSYLFRGIRFNKNCINIFGLGPQLCLRINGAVFFTGQPEFNVFLTELCPEELRKDFHPICCRETDKLCKFLEWHNTKTNCSKENVYFLSLVNEHFF